jgi:hypothetical protein
MYPVRRTPTWDAAQAHIRRPLVLPGPITEAAPIAADPRQDTAELTVVRHTAADLMVVRHPRMVGRLLLVAHTGVRRRLTEAGLLVTAAVPMDGLHPPTAAEERHRTAEAEQLHPTEAAVARVDTAVAVDTRPLAEADIAEEGATVVAAVAELKVINKRRPAAFVFFRANFNDSHPQPAPSQAYQESAP